ncbi:unnamed protein product [marine sediment metagenome]|uniref:Uncharacterized protein n=2 Tax=marine sediment metagenome TaxID=412755 RepID=X1DM39_9ZZZZ
MKIKKRLREIFKKIKNKFKCFGESKRKRRKLLHTEIQERLR